METGRPPGFLAPGVHDGDIGDASLEMLGQAGFDVLAPESPPGGEQPRRRVFATAEQSAADDLLPGLGGLDVADIETASLREEPVASPSDGDDATLLMGETFEDERPPAGLRRPRSYDRRPPLRDPAPGLEPPAAAPLRSAPGIQERTAPNCTAPQLRRFIKSRAYVPMHELRRRFAIEGTDDDVSPIALPAGRVFAGLPTSAAQLLGDLMRAGEVGYELSMDPQTPVIVGVYAMRPVPRS